MMACGPWAFDRGAGMSMNLFTSPGMQTVGWCKSLVVPTSRAAIQEMIPSNSPPHSAIPSNSPPHGTRVGAIDAYTKKR
jgi:hypothetical protein